MSKVEENIKDTTLIEALSDRYLAYAMSTIVSRSLPDVRDGLKPVHRRLLYAMKMLKLDPKSGFKKCARVVGDVIGKYHPHGDSAVYMAMVRLAQSFSVRYPLVDGQGNFGNIDGDNPAAMRYTEARITEVATLLMEGLNENAVDFRETYDGEDEEPVVMPGAFPNLLANGSSGIAVGMATNIPPHNVSEVCDGLLYLIKHPECEVGNLVKYIIAPDFPTGGKILEKKQDIVKAYETGKGAFRIRAKWEKEDLGHGQYQIVVKEIPYQVQKSRLIEKIAALLINKKIPMLDDVRDESAEDIRIVLVPKSRLVDADVLMEHLYKQTELETRFNMNLNVLDGEGVPRVLSLKEILQEFLKHRHEVLVRRSQYRLDKINHRLEVLDGYIIAFLNLDEVIKIIREEDEAKAIMMKKFSLTDIQAEAILNMKLRSLRKLEEIQLKEEHKNLSEEKAKIEELLANEVLRWSAISEEIKDIKSRFNKKTILGRRMTEVSDEAPIMDVPLEAMIEKEPITVLLSEKGWIRAVKGHADLKEDFKFKDGDELKFIMHAQTTDKIMLFDTDGKFFAIPANDIPRGRGFGQPVRLMVDLGDSDIIHIFKYVGDRKLIVTTKSGKGFVVKEKDVLAQTKTGKKVLNLDSKDEAFICKEVLGDTLAIIGENRRLLVYPLSEVPEMGRGKGVMLQKYGMAGIGVSDVKTFNLEEGLPYACNGGIRVETELLAWIGKRASVGKLPPFGFPRNNKFDKS